MTDRANANVASSVMHQRATSNARSVSASVVHHGANAKSAAASVINNAKSAEASVMHHGASANARSAAASRHRPSAVVLLRASDLKSRAHTSGLYIKCKPWQEEGKGMYRVYLR